MKKVYRSALGKNIDIDRLRLENEETIAVGNMKVNARGDELGPGGEILKTRNEVMAEYYKLNTPVVSNQSRTEVDEVALYQQAQTNDINVQLVKGSLASSHIKQSQKILDDQEGSQ